MDDVQTRQEPPAMIAAVRFEDMIETVNEFTRLPSYRLGDIAITAYHNHAPTNGNWRWIVAQNGQSVVVSSIATAKMIAFQIAEGRTTMAATVEAFNA